MIKQCLILFISNIIFWIQRIGARAYTNNLPLALVPIGHYPKTEGPNMTLMFWPSKLLGQRISYIVLSRNFAYLHISSLDNLPNEMESPEYIVFEGSQATFVPCFKRQKKKASPLCFYKEINKANLKYLQALTLKVEYK